jgi:hypothetical protein
VRPAVLDGPGSQTPATIFASECRNPLAHTLCWLVGALVTGALGAILGGVGGLALGRWPIIRAPIARSAATVRAGKPIDAGSGVGEDYRTGPPWRYVQYGDQGAGGEMPVNQEMHLNIIRYFQNRIRTKRKQVAPNRPLKITTAPIT